MSYIGNQITGFLGTGSLTVTTSTVAVEGDALFSADGNVVLGDASGDTITINAATASIPNNLNIDSNTLFLNASNNRVGIGNASPATALDVTGTVTSDGLTVDGTSSEVISVNSTANGSQIFFNSATTSSDWIAGISNDATDDFLIYQGASGTGDIRLYTKDKKRLEIDADGDISFYEDTGTTAKLFWDASAEALGIGTTSPSFNLTAKGAANQAFLSTEDSTSTYRAIYGSDSAVGAGAVFGSLSNHPAIIRTNNTERMRIDSSGRVGIGTTSPTASLDIPTGGIRVNSSGADTNSKIGNFGVGGFEGYIEPYDSNAFTNIVNTVSSKGITFQTGGSERLRLNSTGNLLLRQTSDAVYDTNGAGSVASYYGAQFSSAQSTATKTILGNAADGNYMGSATNNSSGNAIINGYVRAVSTVQTAGSEEGILTFATKPSNSSATTRMTIDSSGNTMLAKSSTNTLGTVGHDFGVTGYAMHTRASSNVLYLNRTTSDGNIAEFYKDGSTVGSIYTNAADGGSSSELCIASGNTGLKFDDTNNYIRPTNSAGANRDNIISLGEDDNRFKDLYLGGSVYLGGTASANALDDYEEGTWTPTWTGRTSNPTISYSTQAGFYTKIGDMVYASFRLTISTVSGGSGFLDLAGLPFNINASSGYFGGMMRIFAAGWSGDAAPLEAHTQPSTSVHMKRMDSLFNSTTCYVTELENSCDLIGTIIYKT